MNTEQKKAFAAATNGVSAQHLLHFVLFLIGVMATCWLFMVIVGTFKNKQRSFDEIAHEMAFGVFIYTVIGILIYYT